MLSSTSLLSAKHIIGAVAAAALTAALVVPAAVTHNIQASERVAAAHQLSESTGMHHDQLAIYANNVRDRLDAEAAKTISAGAQTVKANSSTVSTAAASQAITQLASYQKLPDTAVRARIDAANAAIHTVAVKGAQVRQAEAAAEAKRLANTPDGARATARTMMAQKYGWGDGEFQCLSSLWQKESGWSYTAYNPGGGATGIPQALPGSKMASAGSDWQTNAATQIRWGLDYIARSYGSPCSAWSHSQSMNWY
ncbi:hypothetical protein [Diaminobutyricibacter sp. McL0608]|uniref:aggregation-promoting factor C-terminal-like domain-containing protein n=1 Tax=Leifsonia sp. McL0608 TaxID=3143537 RepID=UPI0031F32199